MRATLEQFSEEYFLASTVEVNPYDGEYAILDVETYNEIAYQIGEPIIGCTGGLHYEFLPSDAVLSGRAAVPRHNHRGSESLSLLVMK